ncbi:MAG: hypothetical protein WD688_10320 [Candidatus Binatia bacterium]
MKEYRSAKRWQVSVCPGGTVHIHYGTGSLHVLEEDFLDLLADLQKAAAILNSSYSEETQLQNKPIQ